MKGLARTASVDRLAGPDSRLRVLSLDPREPRGPRQRRPRAQAPACVLEPRRGLSPGASRHSSRTCTADEEGTHGAGPGGTSLPLPHAAATRPCGCQGADFPRGSDGGGCPGTPRSATREERPLGARPWWSSWGRGHRITLRGWGRLSRRGRLGPLREPDRLGEGRASGYDRHFPDFSPNPHRCIPSLRMKFSPLIIPFGGIGDAW